MAGDGDIGAKTTPSAGGLDALAGEARRAGGRGPAPVHLWNPPFCGDIGLKITRDGTWHYRGSPIGRPALTRLFASILRKDPDRYVLVTPVEKVAIEVEDAPFLAVEMTMEGENAHRTIRFRTNVDDRFALDAEHPIRFEAGPSAGVKPYALVRGDLWALVTRPVFYDLVELGETRAIEGREMFGVASAGQFFVICAVEEIEGLA